MNANPFRRSALGPFWFVIWCLVAATILALASRARGQTLGLVSISPVLHWETYYTNGTEVITNDLRYHLIVGEQFPFNICSLQEAGEPDFSDLYTSASYGCYDQDQFVVGSFPEWLAHAYFRAYNTPCSFALAALEPVGPAEPLRRDELSARFSVRTLPDGKRMAYYDPSGNWMLGGLPAPTFPRPDGVKRFCLIPVFSPLAN